MKKNQVAYTYFRVYDMRHVLHRSFKNVLKNTNESKLKIYNRILKTYFTNK